MFFCLLLFIFRKNKKCYKIKKEKISPQRLQRLHCRTLNEIKGIRKKYNIFGKINKNFSEFTDEISYT